MLDFNLQLYIKKPITKLPNKDIDTKIIEILKLTSLSLFKHKPKTPNNPKAIDIAL